MARKIIEKLKHGRNNNLNDIYESQVIGYDGIRLDEKMKVSPTHLQEIIDKIIDGSISVGLTRGIVDITMTEQENQSFIIRTTGGSASVGSGNAKLLQLYANSHVPVKIDDTEHVKEIIEQYFFSIEITSAADFKEAINNVPGSYEFEYKVNNTWVCKQNPDLVIAVPTSEITKYGLKITGPSYGDEFTITYNDTAETSEQLTIETTQFTRLSATYNVPKLKDKVIGKNPTPNTVYEVNIIYNNGAWRINDISINLEDYGITLTIQGPETHPLNNDKIHVKYTHGAFGIIEFAQPTYLKTLGINSCNLFDQTAMVIRNHTIDENGDVVPQVGTHICYARAIYNEDNESGYVVYDENKSVLKLGWNETIPTTESTGLDVDDISGDINHLLFDENGYVIVVCTDTSKICIHPSWSGGYDNVYANYQEYLLHIPVRTKNDTYIHLYNIGDIRNTIDFEEKLYTEYIRQELFSYVKLNELITEFGSDNVIYDERYIYYYDEDSIAVYPLVDDLINVFFCNDYSTEEFLDTNVNVLCNLAYSSNLVDKLRRDLTTRDELNTAVANLTSYINQEINKIKHPFTTITIDQSGLIRTPEDMITGDIAKGQSDTNVVAWIRRNSHAYVCRWNNNRFEAKQLDDLDRTKYADGTDASTDITTLGYDVMMKLPRFWYKSVARTENPGIIDIIFSNAETYVDNTWNEFDGKSFIGVNEAYVEVDDDDATKSKCYSVSGKTPTVNVSQANFKLYARNRNAEGHTGYKIVDYEAHQVMAILGYAYYGNTNIQDVCGSGTSTYPKVTGGRNALGMRDTVKNVDGNSGSTNFWGLENWWGDIYEWMDDLKTTSNGPVNLYEYDGTTVKRQIATNYTRSTELCITKLVFGNKCDVIPEAGEVNSSYNIGFADDGYVAAGAGYVAARSGSAANANGGLAFLSLYAGASYASAYVGSRLLYKGDYIIVDDFSA